MAQHDYVIDNSTGANVRADINSVLQAIASNNSGSSAPSTTYALQSFANTTDSMLQLRNSANNAFVDLRKFDGALPLPDGSVTSPSLFLSDDTNTGLFSSAADTLNFTTGGVERMELGATTIFNEDGADVDFRIEGDTEANLFYVDAGNNRIGIGTASPSKVLHCRTETAKTNEVEHMIQLTHTSSGTTTTGFGTGIRFQGERNNGAVQTIGDINFEADVNSGSNISAALVFKPALSGSVTERMRLDSDGRLLLGTTTEGEGNADDLTIANSGQSGITLRSGTSNDGQIFFSDATSGNGEFAGFVQYSHATDQLNFGQSSQTRATIRDGKFGVGTTDPSHLGHFADATTPELIVEDTTNNVKAVLGADNDVARIGSDSNHPMTLRVNDTEKCRIDTSGNLGIGVTSVSAKLHADNGGSGNVAFLKHSSSGIAVTLVLQNNRATSSLAGEQISFLDASGTQRGKITNTTSSTTYATSSDYRLKENEVEISDGIERVKQLKPYKFNWKHLPDKTVDGFFAHEVENLVEDCVDGTKNKVVTEEDHNNGHYLDKEIGTEIHQMMDHSKLVPLLTAAIKSLITRVEALEAA